MKKIGFTLIELMVVVTILMIISGGSFVYLNRFGATQKLEQSRRKIVDNLRLARNYALTNQTKGGDGLLYVEVEIGSDGTMEALANGEAGLSYFSEDVTESGVSLVKSPNGSVFFSAYEGKLLKANSSPPPDFVPVGIDETVRIVISSTAVVGETRVVKILPSGLINEK